MSTKNIRDWFRNRKNLTGIFAIQTASVPKQIYWLLDEKNKLNLSTLLPRDISITEWHSLYRKHNYLEKVLFDGVFPQFYKDLKNSELLLIFKAFPFWYNNSTNKERKQLEEAINTQEIKEAEYYISNFFNYLTIQALNCVEEKTSSEESYIANMDFETKQVVHFFLRIWLPCYFIHGEYPTTLFYKARNGDYNSIKKTCANRQNNNS
ncbi:hypothetical protein [Sedimentisphaera salicampi]|uniref:Uncharacterized protein n=1 Tax=Sedimentisphaera salicampi TaxID=1941349 RepID=A0A1W6LKJ3_9BACT|nr:hypothetical protein [Sedimentisphaera salicampi]ARN56318.1 hypothetical protein STSP1_00696 [Sedimentisphaera salicampi]